MTMTDDGSEPQLQSNVSAQEANPRGSLIRSGSIYMFATFLSQIASVLKVILIPSLLSPAQLGSWNLLNIVFSYSANYHIGFLHGMNKLYPALRMRRMFLEAKSMRDSIFTLCLALGLVTSVITFALMYRIFPEHTWPLIAFVFAIFAQGVYTYYFCLFRAENRFQSIGLAVSFSALVSTLCVVGYIYFSQEKLAGAVYGLALGQVVSTIFIIAISRERLRLSFQIWSLKGTLKEGFPILLIGFLDMIFVSADRWILSTKTSPENLGFYSFSVMICGVMLIISGVLSNLIYTRLIEINVDSNDGKASFILFRTSLVILSYILLGIVCGIWSFGDLFILTFASKYASSVPVLNIQCIGYFFLSLSTICSSYAIAISSQIAIVKRQVIAIVILVLLGSLLFTHFEDLSLFAWGVCLSITFLFLLNLTLAYRVAEQSYLGLFLNLLKIAAPLLLAFSLSKISSFSLNLRSPSLAVSVLIALIEFLIIFFVASLLFVGLNRSILVSVFKSLKSSINRASTIEL